MKLGVEIPKVAFSELSYSQIAAGSFLIGFDLDNAGKLSKIDNLGNITVLEVTEITGDFLPLGGGSMDDGAIISSADGVSIKLTFDDTNKILIKEITDGASLLTENNSPGNYSIETSLPGGETSSIVLDPYTFQMTISNGIASVFTYIYSAAEYNIFYTESGVDTYFNGTVDDSIIDFLGASVAIAVTQNRIRTWGIPAYADDAEAGANGLSVGDIYQTSGTSEALPIPGVLMVKQ